MLFGTSSQNEKNLFRNRVLLLLGTVIYPAWWGIFRIASPGADDSVGGRLGVALMLFCAFALSFIHPIFARNLNRLVLATCSALTVHYFWLLHLNPNDVNYLMGSFVTVFAASSCFTTRRQSIAYAIFVMVVCTVVVVLHEEMPQLVLVTGLITGLFFSYVGVSSRLRVLEALLRGEQRFRTMADSAPVMIWTSDEHGACNYFNEVWLKFTGSTLSQASGNGWTKSLHPDDLNGYLEKYFSAFRARRGFQGNFRLRRADGAWRWVQAASIPLYHSNNRFEGYIGTCVDITSTKENADVAGVAV